MPASPSSTCATVGSGKRYALIFQCVNLLPVALSSTPIEPDCANDLLLSSKPSKAKSRSKSKSDSAASSKDNSQKSDTSSVDQPDYSSQRIADYVSDPVDPNHEYTYYTVEESVMSHTIDAAAFLDAFDATMANLEG
jgi:hypothetical protein